MKFLTINVGLLDYKLCGITIFSNPPYSEQRILVIPAEILKIDADVVTIQECYYECHAKYLFDHLKHVYPYMARIDNRNFYTLLNLHNGLIILSKHEIKNTEIISHGKVDRIEWWFADKSTLTATIYVKDVGDFAIINTHPTAGGNDPDSNKADIGRQYALTQTIEVAKKCKEAGSIPVLIGDFNCATDTSALNYEQIINAGYRDTYIEAELSKVLQANCLSFTWDPENVLNKGGVHGHCPPQRVDHVFLPIDEPTFGAVTFCDVVFHEKIVTLPSGTMCSLSDHYGVVVDVETKRSVVVNYMDMIRIGDV